MAKTKLQKNALHKNRAACYLKLHDFKKAAEECTSVLKLDQNHTGALILQAHTLVTLKKYHSALFDVNRLIELNPSSEVYQNLEAPLRTQLRFFFPFPTQGKSLAPIPESEAEFEEKEEEEYKEEDLKVNSEKNTPLAEVVAPQAQPFNRLLEKDSKGWQAIPKPKGHSTLDYGRWNRFEDDDDDDDDEEDQPQDRFHVKTITVRPVK
ncbi:hypothetical protein UlMin_011959 [Ulmus minor]